MTSSLSEMSLNLQSALVERAYAAVVHHIGEPKMPWATRERAEIALDIWKAGEGLTDAMRTRVLARFWPASAIRPADGIVGYLPVMPA